MDKVIHNGKTEYKEANTKKQSLHLACTHGCWLGLELVWVVLVTGWWVSVCEVWMFVGAHAARHWVTSCNEQWQTPVHYWCGILQWQWGGPDHQRLPFRQHGEKFTTVDLGHVSATTAPGETSRFCCVLFTKSRKLIVSPECLLCCADVHTLDIVSRCSE